MIGRLENPHFRRGDQRECRTCTSRHMIPCCAGAVVIDLERLARSLTRFGLDRTNRNCRRPEGKKPVAIL